MSNQFNLAVKAVPVATSVTLTGSWVAGNVVPLDTNNCLEILITYAKGDETGLKLKIEGTADVSLNLQTAVKNATNWYQRVTENTTGGTTTATAQVIEFAASGSYSEFIYPIKGDGVRISFEADTLGAAPGTVSISAVTGWA